MPIPAKTVKGLKEQCRELGIKGFSNRRKEQLIALVHGHAAETAGVRWTIAELGWGHVRIHGAPGMGRTFGTAGTRADLILCGGLEPVQWDWKNPATAVDTSTKHPLVHSPGITQEAIGYACQMLQQYRSMRKFVILSDGFHSQLPVSPGAGAVPRGVTAIRTHRNANLQTLFNRYNTADNSVCALLLHTTC